MKRRTQLTRAALSASLLVAAALPVTVRGESLWERRDPRRAFMFYDVNARHKGDVITVVISDKTSVQNSDDREMKLILKLPGEWFKPCKTMLVGLHLL